MKQTDMLEWMSDIDSAFVLDAERPVIRRRKRRILPMLIAAAAAVTMLSAVGAAAMGLYHRESVSKYFGACTEEALQVYGIDEPVTVSNEHASITADVLLYDGDTAEIILTLEADTPFEARLPIMMFCGTEGQPLEEIGLETGSGFSANLFELIDQPVNTLSARMTVPNISLWNGQTLLLRVLHGFGDAGTAFDGLELPLTFTQHFTLHDFVSMNGDTVQFSGYELICPAALSGENPVAELMHASHVYRLIWNDGSTQEIVNCGISTFEGIAHSTFYDKSPYTVNGEEISYDENFATLWNVDEIAAIEIDGIIYDKVN